jgi:hypothetical protein
MQLDELEARHCRKKIKNTTAKSPISRCCKGRCCKVDAVKVKGLPGGGLFDIGVYTFSRPRKVVIYILGTTPTPSPLQYCLLVSKDKKLPKIEKDSHRSLKPSKN